MRTHLSQDDVEMVIRFLQGRGWKTAAEVLDGLGREDSEDNRRWVRDCASHSGGRIASGPSSPGYCLTVALKPEDWRFVEAIKAQSDMMRQRYIDIQRVWHTRGEIKPADPAQGVMALA